MPDAAPSGPHPAAIPSEDAALLHAEFLRHICQTSSQPLGLVVARAAGTTIWDHAGHPFLDVQLRILFQSETYGTAPWAAMRMAASPVGSEGTDLPDTLRKKATNGALW